MEYEIKNAVIQKVILGFEDHGILTAMLILDYGDGSTQGFGGYCLYNSNQAVYGFNGPNACGHFIYRVLKIAGVTDFEDLVGKTLRVKASMTGIESIGHIIKDDWFNPNEELSTQEEKING